MLSSNFRYGYDQPFLYGYDQPSSDLFNISQKNPPTPQPSPQSPKTKTNKRKHPLHSSANFLNVDTVITDQVCSIWDRDNP